MNLPSEQSRTFRDLAQGIRETFYAETGGKPQHASWPPSRLQIFHRIQQTLTKVLQPTRSWI